MAEYVESQALNWLSDPVSIYLTLKYEKREFESEVSKIFCRLAFDDESIPRWKCSKLQILMKFYVE